MSNNQIQGFVDGQMDAEVTWRGQTEILKMNHTVFVSEKHQSISIQGWALYHETRGYYVVDIWLPKDQLGKANHEMGQGEDAPAGAYLGSTRIPHSGFAKHGRITNVHWEPTSRLFKADFEFDVDITNVEVKVKGSVVVNGLKPTIA